jgi:hypothetical protein
MSDVTNLIQLTLTLEEFAVLVNASSLGVGAVTGATPQQLNALALSTFREHMLLTPVGWNALVDRLQALGKAALVPEGGTINVVREAGL